MSQNFTENCFAAGNPGLTDLQNMENNFLCLKSLFSGSSAPADSTGGMPWFDSGQKVLKIRNSTNGAWLGVHYSSSAARWWVYANAAGDGWIVDSSITDRVCAIKGGSQAYSTSGGLVAGSWTISGITAAAGTHNHQWYSGTSSAVGQPKSYNSTGGSTLFSAVTVQSSAASAYTIQAVEHGTAGALTLSTNYYTDNSTIAVSISSTGSWRPAAAVGTLQYLDL